MFLFMFYLYNKLILWSLVYINKKKLYLEFIVIKSLICVVVYIWIYVIMLGY